MPIPNGYTPVGHQDSPMPIPNGYTPVGHQDSPMPAAPKGMRVSKKLLAVIVAGTAAFSMGGAIALNSTVFSHTGPTGAQGPVGAAGVQGIQGIQGIQGDKGPRGKAGAAGAAGATGASGANGVNGVDGQTVVAPCSNDLSVALPYC
jgi:hypothetical protein